VTGFWRVSAASEKAAQGKGEWSARMKELAQTLRVLLPDLISDQRFNSPERRKEIDRNTQKLAELAHAVGSSGRMGKPMAPDGDVSIGILGSLFQEEARRAASEMKRGNRQYARSILKTMPSFCIACHTRSDRGPDLSSLKSDPPSSFTNRIDRAEFLAATRQFDRALSELQAVLSDPNSARDRQLEWERSARRALVIAVRVKKDPAKARDIVERVLASPATPEFLREDATEWKASIEDWQSELQRLPTSPDGLYSEARRLLAQARAKQKFPMDHASDVTYLRASALTHDLLNASPSGEHVTDGLLMAGIAYEALSDLELWSLHEFYYEACVHRSPHSETARACYRRYEESVYAGYTGSAGVSIPADVAEHLRKLSELASEQKQAPGT
jgi:hypothetical protein